MATLYPAQGVPQHIEAPEGGFTWLGISTLIQGAPFYWQSSITPGIIAVCEGSFGLHMPQNMHEHTLKMVTCGDALAIPPEELAPEEYEAKEHWESYVPEEES